MQGSSLLRGGGLARPPRAAEYKRRQNVCAEMSILNENKNIVSPQQILND
jgi:hypothetical protein